MECETIGMSGWTTGQMVERAREGSSDAKIISTFANSRHVLLLLQWDINSTFFIAILHILLKSVEVLVSKGQSIIIRKSNNDNK